MGNPTDGPQLAPAIARITRRVGRAPRSVTADRGYGQAAVEARLHELGVRSVAIPRASKPGAARREFRTPKSVPGENQMADRIRRTDQPSETQLRLEPHRNHRHHRGPNLVRTRRLRPQPGQDQRPRRLNRAGQSSRTRQLTRSRRSSHHSNPFQVEVANCHAQHPQKLRAILGVTEMYLRLEPYCNAFHFIFRTTSCGLFTQAICWCGAYDYTQSYLRNGIECLVERLA